VFSKKEAIADDPTSISVQTSRDSPVRPQRRTRSTIGVDAADNREDERNVDSFLDSLKGIRQKSSNRMMRSTSDSSISQLSDPPSDGKTATSGDTGSFFDSNSHYTTPGTSNNATPVSGLLRGESSRSRKMAVASSASMDQPRKVRTPD
jgi:hypothetical protein